LLEQSKGKEPKTAPKGRRGREMAKHKASIPFGEYVRLLWERNELKRLMNECEAQEREATVRLQKILKIRELLGMADAPAEVRQAVDELIGVDILAIGARHGNA